MAGAAIEVRGLRKSYAGMEVLHGIDLEVPRGTVFALLGPNGAGKTTTVEILEGHRRRDGGEARVLGHDPGHAGPSLRRRIGIVLQETGVEPYLTVEETVELFRGYYPDPLPLEQVLDTVGLATRRGERVKRLSGGQQRRLDVAVGLAGNPELLFLDEPTTGFDPSARRGAWDMVRGLRDLGTTVVLTTHYMDEAQNLADRVAILVGGAIVAEGTPEQLARSREATISFRRPPGDLPPVEGAAADGDRVTIVTTDPVPVLHRLTSWAIERAVDLEGLTVSRPTLEDVFLELTGDG